MTVTTRVEGLKASDFASDQEVRWCPGCGDYAILKAVQKTLADVGAERHNTVFVSGIGCASRLPYYMSTYGFHTIHGRAPAFVTGIKLANPDLDVWMVTGDGDGLSIGGNHLLHILRRNVDVQILLFNNEIYGLTKGQYSPASRVGTRSPSTPMGSVEAPVSACALALGASGRFVARGIDTAVKDLSVVMKRAREHKGASFVEIYQNCIVYNDKVFADFTDRDVAIDRQIHVEHGKPLKFGKDGKRGLILKPGLLELEVATIGENGVSEDDLLVHDETNHAMASLLVSMSPPALPMALGVLYCDPATSYEDAVYGQIKESGGDSGTKPDFNAVLRQGHTWTIEG